MRYTQAMAESQAVVSTAMRLRLIGGVCLSTILLCIARLLVAFVRPVFWARALGTRLAADASLTHPTSGSMTDDHTPAGRSVSGALVSDGRRDVSLDRSEVALVARLVERAATKLPGTTKCLPRAMVVQWLLRRRGIASILVIAVHARDRSTEHGYHAWVEHHGDFVIGDCDRAEYRPIMAYRQDGGARRG